MLGWTVPLLIIGPYSQFINTMSLWIVILAFKSDKKKMISSYSLCRIVLFISIKWQF